MSYTLVLSHIEKVFHQCGDNISIIQTGNQVISENGDMSIEIQKIAILKQNNCCCLPSPFPECSNQSQDKYWINRVRISPSLADDYSKNFPLSDEELKKIICTKKGLFGCY